MRSTRVQASCFTVTPFSCQSTKVGTNGSPWKCGLPCAQRAPQISVYSQWYKSLSSFFCCSCWLINSVLSLTVDYIWCIFTLDGCTLGSGSYYNSWNTGITSRFPKISTLPDATLLQFPDPELVYFLDSEPHCSLCSQVVCFLDSKLLYFLDSMVREIYFKFYPWQNFCAADEHLIDHLLCPLR